MAVTQENHALLKAFNLGFSYGENRVLKEVNLELFSGQILGILGPNGSGKSTLLGLLSGLLTPSKGDVFLQNKNLADITRNEIAQDMGLSPQQPQLAPGFSALQTVLTGRFARMGKRIFEDAQDMQAALKALVLTGLDKLADRQCGQLSGGERQRLALARALAAEPKILLLDEPTSALDMDHQLKVMSVLENFCRVNGQAVCMVSHDLNLSSLFCDRLMILHKGEVAAFGKPNEVIKPDILEKAYGVKTIVDVEPTRKRPRVTLIP